MRRKTSRLSYALAATFMAVGLSNGAPAGATSGQPAEDDESKAQLDQSVFATKDEMVAFRLYTDSPVVFRFVSTDACGIFSGQISLIERRLRLATFNSDGLCATGQIRRVLSNSPALQVNDEGLVLTTSQETLVLGRVRKTDVRVSRILSFRSPKANRSANEKVFFLGGPFHILSGSDGCNSSEVGIVFWRNRFVLDTSGWSTLMGCGRFRPTAFGLMRSGSQTGEYIWKKKRLTLNFADGSRAVLE